MLKSTSAYNYYVCIESLVILYWFTLTANMLLSLLYPLSLTLSLSLCCLTSFLCCLSYYFVVLLLVSMVFLCFLFYVVCVFSLRFIDFYNATKININGSNLFLVILLIRNRALQYMYILFMRVKVLNL